MSTLATLARINETCDVIAARQLTALLGLDVTLSQEADEVDGWAPEYLIALVDGGVIIGSGFSLDDAIEEAQSFARRRESDRYWAPEVDSMDPAYALWLD